MNFKGLAVWLGIFLILLPFTWNLIKKNPNLFSFSFSEKKKEKSADLERKYCYLETVYFLPGDGQKVSKDIDGREFFYGVGDWAYFIQDSSAPGKIEVIREGRQSFYTLPVIKYKTNPAIMAGKLELASGCEKDLYVKIRIFQLKR